MWFPTIYFYQTGYSLHTLRQASRRSWRIGQRLDVRVKFLIYDETTQRTCLRLMGRKMLVALMMEGKFSGEGIHSMDADDDLLAAMARELVEQGGVGESADAVWAELRRERAAQAAAAAPQLPKPEEWPEDDSGDPGYVQRDPAPDPRRAPGPVLAHRIETEAKKVESIWPTGYVVGEQLRLFG